MSKSDFQYSGWNYYTLQCGTVMYNVLSGLAACGRLGVAARSACLFVTRSSTRPAARDQRHASHVGATPAD